MKYFYSIFVTLLFFASAQVSFAATIYVLPALKSIALGDELAVDILVDSGGVSINAGEATINWQGNVLEFVGAEKEGSVFNFWIDEPRLGSTANSLHFIGGSAKGVSGAALQILRIKFKARGTGVAVVSLSETVLAASDGKGTSILPETGGASYAVGVPIVVPTLPEAGVTTPVVLPPQPVVVVRKPLPAKILPQKPEIELPLYRDQTLWSNIIGELGVFWKVPDDVVSVAVSLDHSPNTIPRIAEHDLVTGKHMGVVEEGVWFVHVRFANNVGWGPVAHRRLQIDITPPLPFEIILPDGGQSDDPAPTLQFRTSDELSGLMEYEVCVDGVEVARFSALQFSGSFTLPVQPPGEHEVVVRAVDEAGNKVEDSAVLNIAPIPSPSFVYVSNLVFSDEESGLVVKGTALPGSEVLLHIIRPLEQGMHEVAEEGEVRAGERGTWEFVFVEALRNGEYAITAQTRDARGALSEKVRSEKIAVKSKPLFTVGYFSVGKGAAIFALLALILTGFIARLFYFRKRQLRLARRVNFAETEVTKTFNIMTKDVDRLAHSITSPTTDDNYALDRLRYNMRKLGAYLKKGIDKIKS